MFRFNSQDNAPKNNPEFADYINTHLDNQEGLKAHYQHFIEPFVQEFEEKRLEKLEILNKRKFYSILVMCVVIPLFVIFAIKTPDISYRKIGNFIVLFALLSLGLYLWIYSVCYGYQTKVKKEIFPLIFNFFGKDFSYQPISPINIKSFEESGIIPDFDVEHTEDYITGSYKGVGLSLLETTLSKESQYNDNHRHSGVGIGLPISRDLRFFISLFMIFKNYFFSKGGLNNDVIFKGMIVTLEMNKNFSQKTIITKDNGAIKNWFNSQFQNLENVKLEDPIFEEQYEVYSSSQVEARYLLTTSFMERFLELSRIFDNAIIELSFYDNKLVMMIPSKKDRFEAKSIFYPTTFTQEINQIVAEMNSIFQIIDILKLNQKTGL